VELEYGVSAGIRLRSLAEGLVPIFEEHMTRLERGISIEDWGKMDSTEKALVIASRRIAIAMKNLQSEAEIRSAESKMKHR
jgi:hypothetical protein